MHNAQIAHNRNLVSCVIPNAVITMIENNLFQDCVALSSFEIPSTVTEIKGNAFANCIALKHLSIPPNVTTIFYWVFNGCKAIEYFILQPITPPVLTHFDSFNNTNNCPIYVPDASLDAYKAANNWNKHTDRIKPMSEFVE